MEEKIKTVIHNLFEEYGLNKGVVYPLKQERILNLCMNDLASHPCLEDDLLDSENNIYSFVIKTILNDVSIKQVKKIC